MPAAIDIEPAVISAPFGNYVRFPGTTPTVGTFTVAKRAGRAWRVIRTVRRYRRLGAWVNKIGLRNPGIEWLERKVRTGGKNLAGSILSVHGFAPEQWWTLLTKAEALAPRAIELNMSCPNVGEVNWPPELFERAALLGTPVIVKIPPVRYGRLVNDALDAGLRALHCCNTLPVPGGGMSGKPLTPLALACIERVRSIAGEQGCADELLIIGGGGITTPDDVDAFADAGAHRFALGSVLMHPRYLFGPGPLRSVLERASERSTTPGAVR